MYFLRGTHLGLRAIEPDDASEAYLSWLNDEETTRGLESGKYPTTLPDLRRYLEQVAADPHTVMLAMIEQASGRHVGNIKLHNFNWLNRTGEIGLLIGDKTAWGKGYGAESCQLVLAYGFNRLNLHKIWLAVYANNPAAIRLYEKIGFVHEGRQREQVFSDGVYVDKLFMGMLAHEWKVL
ncbi:MAG: GNAT family protein [Bacteroidia bacterium]|jgi:RimJ/RimL family protein N-acetyltransferase|nr:GNAT family protein [Bacteroidia bacterium]